MEWQQALSALARGHEQLTPLAWDRLMNISLYMDQVISYTEQNLSPLKRAPGEKLLTKAMINNYSKDGLIHPTERKRYAREHLALIFMIYFLKQTLSIPDVRALLPDAHQDDFNERCTGFDDALRAAMAELDGRVEALSARVAGMEDPEARAAVYDEALRLAMEAYARKRIVEQMIDLMKKPKEEAPAKG